MTATWDERASAATASRNAAARTRAPNPAPGPRPLSLRTLCPRLRSIDSSPLERHHRLDHDAVELRAVADVRGREVLVLLLHVLDLGQHVGREEPAAAGLDALDGHVIRHPLQATFRSVPATRHVELVLEEAVGALRRVVIPVAIGGLARGSTLRLLDVAEELEALILHERVD